MLILTVVCYLVSTLRVLSAPALEELPGITATAPPEFNITSVRLDGTGCPPGSTTVTLSGDKAQMSVQFSELYAEAGPGIPVASNRRTCLMSFGYELPSESTFLISSSEYLGYYKLDANVAAIHQFLFYLKGEILSHSARSEVRGPVLETLYKSRDVFDSLNWQAPCGTPGIITAATQLRVNNSPDLQGTGYIGLKNATEGSFSTTFNLDWYKCKQS